MIKSAHYRILMLIDSTASMGRLLYLLKNKIYEIFELCYQTLRERGFTDVSFQVQVAAYRDYDCGTSDIFYATTWRCKPQDLKEDLKPLQPKTATAYHLSDWSEAIEIGLQHAVKEAQILAANGGKLNQVILIGDAPSKTLEEVKKHRKRCGMYICSQYVLIIYIYTILK